MANGIAISLVLSPLVLGLASCSQTETAEQCIERFTRSFPDPNFFGSGPWRSSLIYRLDQDFKVPELQPGAARDDSRGKGPKFTIAVGPGEAAFDDFSKQDLPERGAYLAWNNVTYFRTRGLVAIPKQAIAAACADGPKGSRLIRIDFAPNREATIG